MRNFAPSPDIAYNAANFAWWENGFTEKELDSICEMGERRPLSSAMIGMNEGEVYKDYRESLVSWIPSDGWLADKLEYIARQINGQFFGLDLWGFAEEFQYTVYKSNKKSTNGHYNWHMDKGQTTGPPRKLSLVLQLSDPNEYEGGDLEMMLNATPEMATKQRGIIYAFPSYVMHRVTPVTKGTRRTLVVWIAGPRFK